MSDTGGLNCAPSRIMHCPSGQLATRQTIRHCCGARDTLDKRGQDAVQKARAALERGCARTCSGEPSHISCAAAVATAASTVKSLSIIVG